MPRRNYNTVTLTDRITFILGFVTLVPVTAISRTVRRLWRSSDYGIKDDIFLALVRRLRLVPLSIRRKLGFSISALTIRESPRFSNASPEICKKTSHPSFEGYWICRGHVHKSQKRVSESDVTLLWLHGGAYVSGSALAASVSLLRIAEVVTEQGVSINIFSLEYSLAPEAKFQIQLDEVTAAYRFLVEEKQIDPTRIMVFGESAGGHLALSLAYNLQQQGMPRPGKLALISPWVNLANSGASFATNEDKDSLDKRDLDQCVDRLLGGSDGMLKFADYVNFAAPLSTPRASAGECKGVRWSQVLPPTWVTVGGNDVFLLDVSDFVNNAKGDGVHVDLRVEHGKPHGWFGYRDALRVKDYLGLLPTEEAGFMLKSSEELARVVLDYVRGYQHNPFLH
ncbi:Alpha/Beta hydrolase protein [Aspergillus granulosus]|uniref:Alpha/Beta hydrolase protein n=1 Tax=Aspergillus granulosus TaxID=176169 RepID=A0ABR4H456_9EURO